MTAWKVKMALAALACVIGFAALVVGALVVQLRRHGRPGPLRLLGIVAASAYVIGLLAFTMFPLPSSACASRPGPIAQWIPLHVLADIVDEAATTSWSAALRSFAVIQVVLNVLLFVPLGVILRRVAHRRLGAAIAIGFAVSLGIEISQYTGIWGLDPCGARIADVDDLLSNTGGVALGVLAPARLLRRPRWRPAPVPADAPAASAPRRWLGMLLDWLAFSVAALSLSLGLQTVELLLVAPGAPPVLAPTGLPLAALTLVAVLVVFCLPALHGSGASLGQRLVGIAPRWDDARGATLGRRLLRACAVAGVYGIGQVLVPALTGLGAPAAAAAVVGTLTQAVALADVAWAAVGDHRGLSGRVSGARMLDTRDTDPPTARRGTSDRRTAEVRTPAGHTTG